MNEQILNTLPDLPDAKKYHDKYTAEQLATLHCIQTGKLTVADEKALTDGIEFYDRCFPYLMQINLSTLTDQQADKLKVYLKQVFNTKIVIFNDIHFHLLFRITTIIDNFLDNGKVRDAKFISYPPIELNRQKNVYNRANSPDRTVLYASFYENVAMLETKPQVGQRIIISTWQNISGQPFNSYPISNNYLVPNEGVIKATKAFTDLAKKHHPLFATFIDRNLSFLAFEFVKSVPILSERRYEYLFSAFFADRLLQKFIPSDPTPNYDFLIYPSVAWNHIHDNIAIMKETVDTKLRPIHLREFEVIETSYDRPLNPTQFPARLKFIREARQITNDKIKWEDD